MSSLVEVGIFSEADLASDFVFHAAPSEVTAVLRGYESLEGDLLRDNPDSDVYPFIDQAMVDERVEEMEADALEAHQQAIAAAETEEERKALLEKEPEYELDARTYAMRLSMLERLELSGRVRRHLEGYFGPEGTGDIGSGMSTDVFTPSTDGNQVKSVTRDVYSTRLYESRSDMEQQDYLAVVGSSPVGAARFQKQIIDPSILGREMWRISIRLKALSDVDYGKFIGDLKAVIEPTMTAYRFRKEILTAMSDSSENGSLADSKILVLGPDPKLGRKHEHGANGHAYGHCEP